MAETKVTVEIDQGVLAAAVADHLSYRENGVAERVEDEAKAVMRKAIGPVIHKLTEERLSVMLDELLAGGIQRTNRWGDKEGEPTSFRSLVLALFTEEIGDPREHFRSERTPKAPMVGWMIRDLLKDHLTKSFQAELAAAEKQIRASIDGLIREKLAAALKSALGIK